MTTYTTGTISINSNSINLVGNGTNWNTSPLNSNWFISFDSGKSWYQVGSINNNTSITLDSGYTGINISGSTYIATDNIKLFLSSQINPYAMDGMDPLTVTALNTVSPLSQMWSGAYAIVFVNGQAYPSNSSSPAFTISGTTLTWNATAAGGVNLTPGTTDVFVLYTTLV